MSDIEDSTTSPLNISSSQFQLLIEPKLADDLILSQIKSIIKKARLEYILNLFHWLDLFRFRQVIIILSLQEKGKKKISIK